MSPDFLRYWRQPWQLIYKPAFRAQLQSALIKWSLIIVKGLVGQQAQLCLPVPSLLCTTQTLQTTNQTLTKCMCVLESVVCKYDSLSAVAWGRAGWRRRYIVSVPTVVFIHEGAFEQCNAQQPHNRSQHASQTGPWPLEGAAFARSFNLLLCLHQLLLMTVLCPTKPTID